MLEPIILRNEILISSMIITCGYRHSKIFEDFIDDCTKDRILIIVLRIWKDTYKYYTFLFGVETLAISCFVYSTGILLTFQYLKSSKSCRSSYMKLRTLLKKSKPSWKRNWPLSWRSRLLLWLCWLLPPISSFIRSICPPIAQVWKFSVRLGWVYRTYSLRIELNLEMITLGLVAKVP